MIGMPMPREALRDAGPLAPLLLVSAFFVAERFVFNMEYREQGITFSLDEIVVAFALVFVNPYVAIVARVAGAAPAMLMSKRGAPVKLAFNISLLCAETAVSAWLMRQGTLLFGDSSSVLLLCVVPAVFVGSALGGLMIMLAIGFYERDTWDRIRSSLGQGAILYSLGAALGATSVGPSLISPYLFFLPILPSAVVWRLMRSQGDLAQRHRDLTEMHAFTRAVGKYLALPDLMEAAQAQARRLLRAEHALLVVFDHSVPSAISRSSSSPDIGYPVSPTDQDWRDVLEADGPVRLPFRDGVHATPFMSHTGWTEALAAPIRDSQGLLGVLVVANRQGTLNRFSNDDISRMAPLTDQLASSLRKSLLHTGMERDATHDRLTGLPNRAVFERLVAEAMAAGAPAAVYLLDLDRFKEVNDGLGHHVGDLLLKRFADRVSGGLGPDDVLARLAGDEFAVLSRGADATRAASLGERLTERARHTFDLAELSVAVACSVGLAVAPDDGTDSATLLRRADLAMYQAKARSSGFEQYTADMDSDSADRLELLRDLRVAVTERQFDLFFQPKVDLQSRQVVGAESLVRWHHPVRGLFDAEGFIHLAEQTDLIHQITEYVMEEALAAAAMWHYRGWRIGVAVNMSARSLLDESLVERVAARLERHGVEPALLTIEITETSVMMDATRSIASLERLRGLGVKLSVDDFGTGYASLTYLRRLPVSELKIDRAFIAGMLTDPHDQIIVRSTIDLGRHLGLTVVAEGVENDLIAHKLKDLGCDIGQGIGFARPLPLAEFHAWVATHGHLGTRTTDAITPERRATA